MCLKYELEQGYINKKNKLQRMGLPVNPVICDDCDEKTFSASSIKITYIPEKLQRIF